MAEENIHARVAEIEVQMSQMASLITNMKEAQEKQMEAVVSQMKEVQEKQMEAVMSQMKEVQEKQMKAVMSQMKELLSTSQATTSNLVGAAPTKERLKVPVVEEELYEEEAPTKISPVVIELEETKGRKDAGKGKEAMRLAKIEECLANQGYELQQFDNITMYAKVQVPENYKEPEFANKYDGTGCPKSHLKYYQLKMAKYLDNAPLLIASFPDSLQGAALSWYIDLSIEDYKTWNDLKNGFMRQYKFNVEVLPTREDLVRTKKRLSESICKYAQRWTTVASRVKPVIQEDELIELFLKSLPYEYYEKMHTSGSPTFVSLIKIGERIERNSREKRALQDS